jgi:hypothetical protein
MANASTIRRQLGGTQQLTIAPIASQVGAITNIVMLNNNALTLAGGGVVPLSVGVTGLYAGTGQVLRIRATGTAVAADASSSLAIVLYQVSAAQIAAGGMVQANASEPTAFNSMATVAAVVPGVAGQFSFTLNCRIQLDAAGNLSGDFDGKIFDTITARTAITSVTGLAGEQDLNFVLGATTIATHGLTTIQVTEFSVDFE